MGRSLFREDQYWKVGDRSIEKRDTMERKKLYMKKEGP